MKNQNLGHPVKNKHKVPKKQWNKWTNFARKIFNATMYSMRPRMQWMYLHPEAPTMPKEHWGTLSWNAAWTAASIVNEKKPLGAVIQNGKSYDGRTGMPASDRQAKKKYAKRKAARRK